MPAPKNKFKQALKDGRLQIGLWQALLSPEAAEITAGAGFDWLVLDGEHAPNDLPLFLAQLRAMEGYHAHPVIRPPIGETWLIKQLLDIGAQTLLIPMVETKAMAEALVKAMLYPPHGVRGVGASLGRASRYSSIPDYVTTANAEMCLLLQVESRAGLAALDDIAGTDGVDGVFIGPSDLAADMGYLGQPSHPEVHAVIEDALKRIQSHGKAAGILTSDLGLARRYADLGATFVAIGTDVTLLASASRRLLADFAGAQAKTGGGKGSGY